MNPIEHGALRHSRQEPRPRVTDATTRPATNQPLGRRHGAWWGAATALPAAAVFGVRKIAHAPQALKALPAPLQRVIKTGARAGTGWCQSLEVVTAWVIDPAARHSPQIKRTLGLPQKSADILVSYWATLVEGLPAKHVKALIDRDPYSPYPAQCDWSTLQSQCPDPLAYARAATLAPFISCVMVTTVGVVLGAMVGFMAWQHVPASMERLGASPTFGRLAPWYLRVPLEVAHSNHHGRATQRTTLSKTPHSEPEKTDVRTFH